jgi:hypothetical protein
MRRFTRQLSISKLFLLTFLHELVFDKLSCYYCAMLMLSINFDSNTWGTVSDWVIAISTVFSLYFLIRTLRSQLKVQKLQLKSVNIENARFLKDQNLTLPIDIKSCQPYKLGEVSFRVQFILLIVVENANFKKMNLSFDREVILGAGILTEYSNLYAGDSLEYKFSLEIPYQQYLDDEQNLELKIEVLDYAENRLRKTVNFRFGNGFYEIEDGENRFERIPEDV